MKISKIIVCFVSVILFGSLLNARGMNPTPFEDFDGNKDGFITMKEFDNAKKARMAQNANSGMLNRNAANSLQFSEIDANRDGKATKSELINAQQLRMQRQRMNNMNNKKRKNNFN